LGPFGACTASPDRRHTNRKAEDDSQALAAFIAPGRAEIDTILARLIALRSDHIGCEPETVTWADVGTLANYLKRLREISDEPFEEGEREA
jgi:hypothetical protein